LGKTLDAATKSSRERIVGWSLRQEILCEGQRTFGLADHHLGLGEQRLYQEWKIGRRKHLVQPAQSSHNTSRICSLEGQHHFGYSYLPEDVVIKHGTTTKNIVCLGKTGHCFIQVTAIHVDQPPHAECASDASSKSEAAGRGDEVGTLA
jgi:hypothetical protein